MRLRHWRIPAGMIPTPPRRRGWRSPRAQKRQEAVKPALAQGRQLVGGRQFPGGDVDGVGRGRIERAHGHGHDVVDDQVRIDQHVAVHFGHGVRSLLAVAGNQIRAQPVDFGACVLTEQRLPFGDWTSPRRGVFDHGVTVAEIHRSTAHAAAQVGADRHQVLEIGVVRGLCVVSVDAILHQQLPVGREAVLVGAADYLHRPVAAVDDEIDVILGVGEIGGQVDDVGVEAGEHEATVGLHALHPLEPQLIEVHASGVGVAVRHTLELSFRVEGPRVVEALENFGIAGVLPAYQRAAVRAGVVEHVDVAGLDSADHEDRSPADRSPDEVARHWGSPIRARHTATTWRRSARSRPGGCAVRSSPSGAPGTVEPQGRRRRSASCS